METDDSCEKFMKSVDVVFINILIIVFFFSNCSKVNKIITDDSSINIDNYVSSDLKIGERISVSFYPDPENNSFYWSDETNIFTKKILP